MQMQKMSLLLAFLLVPALVISCSSVEKTDVPAAPLAAAATQASDDHALPTTLDEALTSSFRTSENLKRDVFRHPRETLIFFGLKPDMTVVEIVPGTGWYAEILAPLLATHGQYLAAVSDLNPKPDDQFANWLLAHPKVAGKIKTGKFKPPGDVDFAPPGSADMVLTFRNIHNWMSKGAEQAAFKAFFKALKPGGVLGVVEHRENAKKKQIPLAKTGYVREDYVINLAKKAGFKFDTKSEINANPKDTKDYEKGVWTLPPTYTLGDKDRAKYEAIGESDRMTLRFIKPAKK
jgi:predicted methyltransferase